MIRAVFFDMDGVLIDTEKYLTVYRQQAMREAGYRMRLEEAYSFRSLASKFAGEKAKKLYGADFDYGKIRMRRKELMAEHIEKYGLEKKPYVAETIGELRRRGCQTAVVTATAEDRTLRYLDMLGFTDLFDVVVCASMVENGKPCPDVYLYACERVGRRPEECMAVEDSPNGVKSAWSAGCHVTMVPDLTGPTEEIVTMTEHVAVDLRGLLEILA